MQLEAIYHDGKLEFCRPVRFVHSRFVVRVDVPENELIEPTIRGGEEPLGAYASGWLLRLKAIRAAVMATPGVELQPVSDEQVERLRAIEMRQED
jgi:hypothetical protein